MENPNLEETSPTHIQHHQPAPEDPGATMPVSIPRDAGQDDHDPTVRISLRPASGDADSLAETIQVPVRPDPIPVQPTAEPPLEPPQGPPTSSRKPVPWRSWSALGLLALILTAALSAFGGYNNGIGQRKSAEATQVSGLADEQFQLGVSDLEAGRFDLARQRFEYVIRLNPSYPGVTDKLADVLMFMNTTATPTPQPTATPSPTPDLRGVEELFTTAQQDLANLDWEAAIRNLLALRKADPAYQGVWVDDMLYISFRNQGADKILKLGDLEGGMYYLSVASQYGPLDTDARSYHTWASLYMTGASFWELDWAQAVYYFGQVAPALPNLRDGSGWTATERYRLALLGYGLQLAKAGDCETAGIQYEQAAAMGVDAAYDESYAEAVEICSDGGDNDEKKDKGNDNAPEATDEPVTTEVPPTEAPPDPIVTPNP